MKVTSHPLSHNCGKAKRLCVKPGRRYARRAFGGNCGKFKTMFAVVDMVVPFGMVMFFGVCLFALFSPTFLCLTNVNDAAESNSAVLLLLYSLQQGLSLFRSLLVLNATCLCPSGADRHLGRHSLFSKEPPMIFYVLHRVCVQHKVFHMLHYYGLFCI